MSTRWVAVAMIAAVMGASLSRAGEGDDARKKAERVASYVALVETITRVGTQVGGMLEKRPTDRALAVYARDLGRLHAKAMSSLTPPEGAEDLHARFKEAVAQFALAADARCSGDYPTARKHTDKCMQDFGKALVEALKMKKEGVLP